MCASRGRAGTVSRTGEVTSILVVDDDAAVAASVGKYLERVDGVVVTVETDPSTALSEFERGGVDLVVSDYEMPGMDGIELLDAVRERDPAVPFVLFTGCGDESVARRARDRDAAYVRKGFSAGGFDRLVECVADRR